MRQVATSIAPTGMIYGDLTERRGLGSGPNSGPERGSLIRAENSLIARFNSL
jgi:hypothetical protein